MQPSFTTSSTTTRLAIDGHDFICAGHGPRVERRLLAKARLVRMIEGRKG